MQSSIFTGPIFAAVCLCNCCAVIVLFVTFPLLLDESTFSINFFALKKTNNKTSKATHVYVLESN